LHHLCCCRCYDHCCCGSTLSTSRVVVVVVACAQLSDCKTACRLLLPADELPGTPYSRRSDKSSSEPGDVELMERTIGSNGDGPHSGACAKGPAVNCGVRAAALALSLAAVGLAGVRADPHAVVGPRVQQQPGYGSDRVRRRTKNDSSSNNSSSGSRYAHSTQQLSQAAEAAVGWLSHAAAGAAAAAQAALPAAATSLTSSCLGESGGCCC
jgi:hypothetical protein